MVAKEKAKELVLEFYSVQTDEYDYGINWLMAKQCAIITVDKIIISNPHSNPLNTQVFSTMGYWQEVKKEIEKL